MSDGDAWPAAAVPERLDRRARLGPFPSARDAAKFLSYAAGGALLVPVVGPLPWIPVVAVGFLVAVWRPDGQALDERALAVLRWVVRSSGGTRAMNGPIPDVAHRHRLLRWDGRYVAVLQAAGGPLAYLPPEELRRRFDRFRDLLRSLGDGWGFVVGAVPVHVGSVRPPRAPVRAEERAAREGYTELIVQIGSRRSLRRVHLLVTDPDPGLEGIGRIEAAATRAALELNGLGVRTVRLTGRELREAAHRLGPRPAGGTP
jgi:hypothetical protein